MQFTRRLDKLKEAMEKSLMIPNVRDAVRGLPPGSSLTGPVEFYGDRSLALPCAGMVRKEPRNDREKVNLEIQERMFKDLGIGPATVHDISDFGLQLGLVNRMFSLRSEKIKEIVNGGNLSFFINTSKAEYLAGLAESSVLGPRPHISYLYNNKVVQRMLGAHLNGHLFPPHQVVDSEEKTVKTVSDFASNGSEVIGKVGHLASGEGMEILKNKQEAAAFWRKWSQVLETHKMRRMLIVEEKKPLRSGINSVSTQFLLDKGEVYYIGPAIQYVNGFHHAGNRVGKEVADILEPWVEEKMVEKSLDFINLGRFSKCNSAIIGFDFIITDKDEILMVECNFRHTASTLLFGLEAQLGSHLTYDLVKMKFPKPLKYDFAGLGRELDFLNRDNSGKVIPLNPRLFEETGEMFVAIASSSSQKIDMFKKLLYCMFS
jgi:hypothetical protein